jgi:hypothetical protein
LRRPVLLTFLGSQNGPECQFWWAGHGPPFWQYEQREQREQHTRTQYVRDQVRVRTPRLRSWYRGSVRTSMTPDVRDWAKPRQDPPAVPWVRILSLAGLADLSARTHTHTHTHTPLAHNLALLSRLVLGLVPSSHLSHTCEMLSLKGKWGAACRRVMYVQEATPYLLALQKTSHAQHMPEFSLFPCPSPPDDDMCYSRRDRQLP